MRRISLKGWFLLFLPWIGFSYFWLYWGWGNFHVFDRSWFFDTAGHFIVSGVGALELRYIYIRHALHGIFVFTGKRHLRSIILEWIFVVGLGWELVIESLLWDSFLQPFYFPWIAQAHKGELDTLLDLCFNGAGALCFLYIWHVVEARLYPEIVETEEMTDIIAAMEHFSSEIRTRRKEQIMQLLPALQKIRIVVKTKLRGYRRRDS